MPESAEKQLHVVAFDVPYPPDYGGVIDVYFRLRALHDAGIKIILHCFEYGRGERKELNDICDTVYYYPRRPMWQGFTSALPFIVATRRSDDLLDNLLSDLQPVLFEGLHSCSLLGNKALDGRLQMVRIHNNEANYYAALSKRERNWFKKLYYRVESARLRKFEKTLSFADQLFCISNQENDYYNRLFGNSTYTGPFHPHQELKALTGKGEYILYHGNLGVNENEEAAMYLLNGVFDKINYPIIIAGKNPGHSLIKEIKKHKHIRLLTGLSEEEMEGLIQHAHINMLVTFQATGVKLKLINSLFLGRFCMTNSPMVDQTGLAQFALIGDNADELVQLVNTYMERPFSEEDLKQRTAMLDLVNNRKAAQVIEQYLR
jgi:hypothetical protein